MKVDLKDTLYAVVVVGGGWSYSHDLYLVTNSRSVYYTKNWKDEEVTPSESLEAEYIGSLESSGMFEPPKKINRCVFDAPEIMVFDNTLDKPIYSGFGVEKEFLDYFGTLLRMEKNSELSVKNENAYSNGKKMSSDEFFAMSGMLLDNLEIPDNLEK